VPLPWQRFELNYETFMREKVNDRFEFPPTLDLYPYCSEGVEWQARVAAAAAAAAAASPPTEAVEEPRPYLVHPKEYYEFELVGVVVHMGTADSGHYYSLIRERGVTPAAAGATGTVPVAVDPRVTVESTAAHGIASAESVRMAHSGEWFEFNDSIVQPFSTDRLPAVTFGGFQRARRWNMHRQCYVEVDEPISNNAYMLVYERVVPLQPDVVVTGPPAEGALSPMSNPANAMIRLDKEVRGGWRRRGGWGGVGWESGAARRPQSPRNLARS
jgi:hypothetical protein